MREQTIILTDSLTASRLSPLLTQLEPLWHSPPQPVRLDLGGVTFIRPAAITLLATAVLRLQQLGFSLQITRPTKTDVDSYLNRLDFYDLIGLDVAYPWRRHSGAGRFREAVQVQDEEEGNAVVRELMTILDRNVAGVLAIYDAVYHAFLEIVNNVFHHAQSPTQAVICAQFYPSFRHVDIAVVDSGRGIPASLAQNPALRGRFTTAAEAIELAVQPRITGRPTHNSGEGLFFSLEFLKANGGRAYILSQDGLFRLQKGQIYSQASALWPGTAVFFSFRTDRPVDTRAIFNRYAPPENDFDWLF